LNELLGWGQLLSGATTCGRANTNFKHRWPLIRCAFATANVSRSRSTKNLRRAKTSEPRKPNVLPMQKPLWRKSVLAQP